MGDIDFEEQLELEKLEQEKKKLLDPDDHPKEKTDPDGTVYEWDIEKKAWFPKIDANFIAQYQISYGSSSDAAGEEKQQEFYQNYYSAQVQEQEFMARKKTEEREDTHDEAVEKLNKLESDIQEGGTYNEDSQYSREAMEKYSEEEKRQYNEYWSYYYGTEYRDYYTECLATYTAENSGPQKDENKQKEAGTEDEGNKKKGKKRKQPQQQKDPGWFDMEEKDNTNVYVSGLPLDISLEEFTQIMSKFGLIMNDPRTKKPKLKLYMDENGEPKGDGRCCYIKKESVDLALKLLDGSDLRGKTVKVEIATFQMKGDYDPSKKKKKLTNKEKRRLKERQQKLFDWRPDKPRFARAKHEKVVILKNVFDPKDFEESPQLINTVRNDVRNECSKYGDVKKTVVYDRHEDGVVSVHFKEAEEADMCVENLNQRFFAKRRILAATWDGKTKYEIEETEAEREQRLKKWETFLESGESVSTDKSSGGESGNKAGEKADSSSGGNDKVETDNTAGEASVQAMNPGEVVTASDTGT